MKDKSVFMSAAELMRDRLGHGLCLAKWQQVSLHLTTGMTNSCYHPPLHEIPAESLPNNPSVLHNTPYKKQQRRIMLRDQRPSECSYCWNIEDAGHLSDRHYRSGEPWAAEHYDSIRGADGSEDVTPSYVEVNFNHACNLRCSYCSPQFSSTWQQEAEQHGAYPTSTPHNAPEYFQGRRGPIPVREHNPYVEAFWQWWPELYPRLRHFRMTGGEPLMDRNTYRVFDYVLALPKPDLHLAVTSNFSVETPLFDRYIDTVRQICDGEKIEHFMQYVSVDAYGGRAEYIRNGLDFSRMTAYVERYLREVPGRNSLTAIITLNNLSVTSLKELLQSILALRRIFSHTYQRVWFDTPLLRQPAWQSLQILPDSYAHQLDGVADWMEQNLETTRDPFQGFKDYEVQRLRRAIDWMREGAQMDPETLARNRGDFYRFFSEHDRRRGTDFLKTFPEMSTWWNLCKYYANE
jgi:hypothetical protein